MNEKHSLYIFGADPLGKVSQVITLHVFASWSQLSNLAANQRG